MIGPLDLQMADGCAYTRDVNVFPSPVVAGIVESEKHKVHSPSEPVDPSS